MAHARADSEPEFLEEDEVAAWNGLLRLSGRVLRALDDGMRAQHGISVNEFDVLITLFNAPDKRLRMAELARSVAVSPAGLTHLVTRLEGQGLVRREVDPGDRRSHHTVLTGPGEARLNAARPVHNAVIRSIFLDRITADDKRRLGRIWAKVSGR